MTFVGRVLNRLRARLVARTDFRDLGPNEFVQLAYLVVMRRKADPTGLADWHKRIERGTFDTQLVIEAMLRSEEYLSNFGSDIFGRLHLARQEWVRTIAPFASILDIGGSSAGRREGALIELGYPHRPPVIDILDLPPDRQFWGEPLFDQSKPQSFDWGTVTYYHGSAEGVGEVALLQDRAYDCIFMGQAIEHIYPEKLPTVLAWIRNHLKPGGRFVFDTPNRAVTKIHSPAAYINADHKIEYTPDQMEQLLAASGFIVTQKIGMGHLPRMAASQKFDAREFTDAALLHADADACYLFAFEAIPDQNQNLPGTSQ